MIFSLINIISFWSTSELLSLFLSSSLESLIEFFLNWEKFWSIFDKDKSVKNDKSSSIFFSFFSFFSFFFSSWGLSFKALDCLLLNLFNFCLFFSFFAFSSISFFFFSFIFLISFSYGKSSSIIIWFIWAFFNSFFSIFLLNAFLSSSSWLSGAFIFLFLFLFIVSILFLIFSEVLFIASFTISLFILFIIFNIPFLISSSLFLLLFFKDECPPELFFLILEFVLFIDLIAFILLCVVFIFSIFSVSFFSSFFLSFRLSFISFLFSSINASISLCCLFISFPKNVSSSSILKFCKYNSSGLLLLIIYISWIVEYNIGIFLLFLLIWNASSFTL